MIYILFSCLCLHLLLVVGLDLNPWLILEGGGDEQIAELNRAHTAAGSKRNFFFSFSPLLFSLRNKVCTLGFSFLSNLGITRLLSQVQLFCHFCFGGDVRELHMEIRWCRTHYIPISFDRTTCSQTLILFWASSLLSRDERFPSPPLCLSF